MDDVWNNQQFAHEGKLWVNFCEFGVCNMVVYQTML